MYGRLETPQLSHVATDQLAAWEAIAEAWPVSLDAKVWRCGDCEKGIALAYDSQGHGYRYGIDQWLALVVLHLRNHHGDLDPDKG